MGAVRFKIWDAGYEASLAALRKALGDEDFEAAWAAGAPYPPRKPSPTRSAAAANAHDPPAGGRR